MLLMMETAGAKGNVTSERQTNTPNSQVCVCVFGGLTGLLVNHIRMTPDSEIDVLVCSCQRLRMCLLLVCDSIQLCVYVCVCCHYK